MELNENTTHEDIFREAQELLRYFVPQAKPTESSIEYEKRKAMNARAMSFLQLIPLNDQGGVTLTIPESAINEMVEKGWLK